MIEVTIKQHLSVLISSLEKAYKKATMYGKLEVRDIYYINLIFKLLDRVELSNDENNKLINFYNNLAYYSDQICPPIVIKRYQTTLGPVFEQTETTDCNTYPKKKEILYWQENYTLDNIVIANLIDDTNYLTDIPSDTYPNFELGKDIEYNKIGKIVFLALESTTTNYKITDILGNDITHTFTITLVPLLQATLMISNNIYSYGNINFKIKQL